MSEGEPAPTGSAEAPASDRGTAPAGSNRPLRIVLSGDMVLPNEPRLHAKADFPFSVVRVATAAPPAERQAAIRDADAVVCLSFDQPSKEARNLRLVQTQSAGYDRVVFDCVPDHAAICNAFGHERTIAEYALMTMLMWTHQWKAVEDSFRAGSWRYSGARSGPLREELNVKTVGILGLGRLGREIALRTQAMGARVLGCARNPMATPGVDMMFGLDRLDAFLAECDFVIVAIALAPETEGLIDAGRLARMKPGAVLMNVGRGPVVNERDLFQALTGGTIGGAILDVWWRYPTPAEPERRPSTFPFHELPNVFMTPHSSAWTEQMMDRRWDMIVTNLRALARGGSFINVVRPAATVAS